MRERHTEAWVRAFHDARPGLTSAALAGTDSYARLAALVPREAHVLDLGCGDGHLCALLGARAVGVDLSHGEARLARERGVRVVQARAAALPFAAHTFDAAASHLAFVLFEDVELVVEELARVLVPGGVFVATLGGGPVADHDDAFHAFLAALALRHRAAPRLGDPRTRSEPGWCELFAGWSAPVFERRVLELHDFAAAWRFLAASYELAPDDADAVRDELRARWDASRCCCIATWLAWVRAPA